MKHDNEIFGHSPWKPLRSRTKLVDYAEKEEILVNSVSRQYGVAAQRELKNSSERGM